MGLGAAAMERERASRGNRPTEPRTLAESFQCATLDLEGLESPFLDCRIGGEASVSAFEPRRRLLLLSCATLLARYEHCR
jgi:hypothetical protein